MSDQKPPKTVQFTRSAAGSSAARTRSVTKLAKLDKAKMTFLTWYEKTSSIAQSAEKAKWTISRARRELKEDPEFAELFGQINFRVGEEIKLKLLELARGGDLGAIKMILPKFLPEFRDTKTIDVNINDRRDLERYSDEEIKKLEAECLKNLK